MIRHRKACPKKSYFSKQGLPGGEFIRGPWLALFLWMPILVSLAGCHYFFPRKVREYSVKDVISAIKGTRPSNLIRDPEFDRGFIEFRGDSLIVGSGWSLNDLLRGCIHKEAPYYLADSGWDIRKAYASWFSVSQDRMSYPDFAADFSNPDHIEMIPSQSFERIVFECIPCTQVENPHFFKNIVRILKPRGKVILKTGAICNVEALIEASVFKKTYGFDQTSSHYHFSLPEKP